MGYIYEVRCEDISGRPIAKDSNQLFKPGSH